MITYTLSRIQRFLRETLALTSTPQACPEHSRRVTPSRTRYIVHVGHVTHQVRRDGVCSCGATFKSPCPAITAVHAYLVAGGARPLGRHPDTWPESWSQVPLYCPICDCPTIPDRFLNSRMGPGWRCSLDPLHFWQVRMEPLRRYLKTNPPQPSYPWYDTPEEERQAWLEAHWRPPRLVPSTEEGDDHHALDRTPPCEGGHWTGIAVPWLDPVRLYRGQVRPDDRLLCAGELGRDRGT